MTEPKYKRVYVNTDQIATKRDICQLIARLPYLAACDLAGLLTADVDKMCDGAVAFLSSSIDCEGDEA